MGIFDKIKKGVVGIGHFAGNVLSNPIAEGIIGMTPLGIPGAAIAGALGGALKPHGGLMPAVTGGATGAASGAVGKTIKGLPGVGTIVDKIGSGVRALPGGDAVANAVDSVGGTLNPGSTGPGAAGGAPPAGGPGGIASLEKLLPKNADGSVDWGSVIKTGGLLGLAGAQGLNAMNLGKQSSQYATDAMDSVKDSYGARAGLRSAGIEGMLHPQTASLGGLMTHSGPYGAGLVPGMPAAPRNAVSSLASFAGRQV